MARSTFAPLVVLPLVLLLSGCERTKSANPLSPTIAGPIAGVEISAPQPAQPASGSQVASTSQPISFVLANASTSGVRPLSYVLEIASDAGFANRVFSQTGISPSASGQTSFRLPQNLGAERTYYWRAKAEDGANASEFSGVASFRVYTPVVIGQPTLVSPADGATVSSARPGLQVTNASVSGPAGDIYYFFEVATNPTMTGTVASLEVPQGPGLTTFQPAGDLAFATRYYWRVRALDPGHLGPWSPVRSFVTSAAPVVVPPPSSGGGGGGSASPNDQVDLSGATIVLGPKNILSWPVTSTVTSTTAQTGALCISHTKLGQWPKTIFFGDANTLLEGNQWVFANIGGKWYGGAADWYRPGQACKDVNAHSIAGDAFYQDNMEPLRSWVPRTGETFAVMSTTPARAYPDMRTVDERTNVVLIKWGG